MTLLLWGCLGNALWLLAVNDPLWLDELHTGWAVSGNWGECFSRSAAGNQSPLYFLLVKLLTDQSGVSPWALRLISLVATVSLGLTLILWLRSTFHSWVVALSSSLMLASTPSFFYYGTEARPYALLMLISVIHLIFVWGGRVNQARLTAAERKRGAGVEWVGLTATVVTAILMVGIHPTALLLLVAEAGFLLAELAWRKVGGGHAGQPLTGARADVSQPQFGALVLAILAGAVWLIPLKPTWQQRDLWASVSDGGALAWSFGAAALPAGVLGGIVLGCRWWSKLGEPDWPRFRTAVRLFLVLASTVGLAVVLDALRIAPVALDRYVISAWGGLPLAAALFVASLPKGTLRWVGLAGAVMIACLMPNRTPIVRFAQSGQIPQQRYEDWQIAVECINAFSNTEPKHVFLLGNILEDSLLENQEPAKQELPSPRDSQGRSHVDELRDYLAFPVNGPYRFAKGTSVESLSTWSLNRWKPVMEMLLANERPIFLISRLDREDLRVAARELRLQAANHGKELVVEVLGPSENVIQAWVIYFRP